MISRSGVDAMACLITHGVEHSGPVRANMLKGLELGVKAMHLGVPCQASLVIRSICFLFMSTSSSLLYPPDCFSSILLCRLALPCLHGPLVVSRKRLACTPANSVQFSHCSIGPLFWPLPARIGVGQIAKICYSLLVLQSSPAYASFPSILTLPPDMRSL